MKKSVCCPKRTDYVLEITNLSDLAKKVVLFQKLRARILS